MWEYLGILLGVSLLICLLGFYKYKYFVSIGYAFSVTGIGTALFTLCYSRMFHASLAHYLLMGLLVLYGLRLGIFLLYREMGDGSYSKAAKENSGEKKKVSFFSKLVLWPMVSVIYVAQTSPVFFQLQEGGISTTSTWVGFWIAASGLLIETTADFQKSAQKKKEPNMVAQKGLYRIVRCPNYFGEILFWTGIFVSSLGSLSGVAQWAIAVTGYVCIASVMFSAAKSLEKRQMERYGVSAEYNHYADKIPILIPLVPLYHLNKKE